MANTYTLISSVTVTGATAASIDFTSIPATYTDLLLKVSSRNTSGAISAFYLQFNANTGSTYTVKWIQGSGSTVSSSGYSSSPYTNNEAGVGGGSTNTFSNNEIYFPNYAGSNNKSWSSDGVEEENATAAYSRLTAGLWANTSAINQITIYSNGSNFAQYSTAYLYGIKNS